MRTFRSDTDNDGLITFFPTILIRTKRKDFSVGFWWGPWCIDFGWWERKIMGTLKAILISYGVIIVLMMIVSAIALLIFTYGVWRICDWWVKPRLIVPCA